MRKSNSFFVLAGAAILATGVLSPREGSVDDLEEVVLEERGLEQQILDYAREQWPSEVHSAFDGLDFDFRDAALDNYSLAVLRDLDIEPERGFFYNSRRHTLIVPHGIESSDFERQMSHELVHVVLHGPRGLERNSGSEVPDELSRREYVAGLFSRYELREPIGKVISAYVVSFLGEERSRQLAQFSSPEKFLLAELDKGTDLYKARQLAVNEVTARLFHSMNTLFDGEADFHRWKLDGRDLDQISSYKSAGLPIFREQIEDYRNRN
jgi:hypothetical protein